MRKPEDKKPVVFRSTRERDVVCASGLRLRGEQMETIRYDGETGEHWVQFVRPALAAEHVLWALLIGGEAKWARCSSGTGESAEPGTS